MLSKHMFLANITVSFFLSRWSAYDAFAQRGSGADHNKWKLVKNRLSEGLVLWLLRDHFGREGKLKATDLSVGAIEHAISLAVKHLRGSFPQKYSAHICSDKGCAARIFLMDGNAKNIQSVCAFASCLRLPAAGNQHVIASRYCTLHSGYRTTVGIHWCLRRDCD